MILLDSNVVSAMMRIDREPAVAAWLRTVPRERLFTSTPTIFEVKFGIESKPSGRRRRDLEIAFEEIITSALGNRIVPLDVVAAHEAARVHAFQRGRGRNTSIPDSQIAGIALTLKVPLATRDIADFDNLGIELDDPWLPRP